LLLFQHVVFSGKVGAVARITLITHRCTSPPGLVLFFFFGRVGPTTASVGLPLKRLERETTLVVCMNGRIASPVCAFDEYLRDGEITIVRAPNCVDLGVFPIKTVVFLIR